MTFVEGGPVQSNVQAFADEADRLLGTVCKTYPGHQPSQDLALDCWDSLVDRRALAQFAMDNYRTYGIDYVIHEQRIWNPEIIDAWRSMEDRGSPTNNHMDHVHVSFVETPSFSVRPVQAPATPRTPISPLVRKVPTMLLVHNATPVWFLITGDMLAYVNDEDANRLVQAGVPAVQETMSEAFLTAFGQKSTHENDPK